MEARRNLQRGPVPYPAILAPMIPARMSAIRPNPPAQPAGRTDAPALPAGRREGPWLLSVAPMMDWTADPRKPKP